MTRITRVEVIDENGRSYVNCEDDNYVRLSYQDDGRTLKVFVDKVKPKTGEEGAFAALDRWLGEEPPEEPKLSPIEQTKKDIETLQRKLKLLEYEETVRSDVEKSYRDFYGHYPVLDMSTNEYDCATWVSFKNGYDAGKKSKEPEENEWKTVALRFGEKLSSIGPCGYYDFTPGEWAEWALNAYEKTADEYLKLLEKERAKAQERGERVHKEVEKLQENNWYVDAKTLIKSNWEPTPQTPEEIEKSLRGAFVKVQQTEKWKETQRKIDGNYSLDLIREWGEKNKPPTLYEILMEWWINHLDMEQSDEEIVDGLVDIIDKKFIPPSNDRNGYEWEKCLKIMRDKLR